MSAREKDTSEALQQYRAKRSGDRTPEPVGALGAGAGGLFVVHKHAARRLHWDLRLEMDGVLRSWAVPRGPSYDQADKRLAVHVEDHPIEYADFEGVIPDGNYGAGSVIIWDRGEWTPVEDPHEGLRKGKLLFDLNGYKLKGRWTLVKIKKGEKEWLLIKEKDAWLRKGNGDDLPQESVLSGLTVEERKAGKTPAGMIREELERLKAPRKVVTPASVDLMLAEPRQDAFTREGWLFELKLDGYRLIAARTGDQPFLRSRNGVNYTSTFPEIARAVAALPVTSAVIDGELTVLDPQGKPSFNLLQQRALLNRPFDIKRAVVEHPATCFAFDLLGFEDFDLRPLPLHERKRLLKRLLPPLGAIRYLDHFETNGEALMDQVVGMGLEGIVAKKADAPYRGGRGPNWNKIRADRTGDFAVIGYTPPKGSRTGFGALHLGDLVNGKMVYAGRAGSGFNDRQMKELYAALEPTRRDKPAAGAPIVDGKPIAKASEWTKVVPDLKGTTWVEPRMVVEVRFKEWTRDGVLRHPIFLRVRDDKDVDEVVRQSAEDSLVLKKGKQAARKVAAPEVTREPAPAPVADRPPAQMPKLSNLTKLYWSEDGYTKGDLVEYYRTIAPWLLPYLLDRPLVLTRFPDGIHGKSFYQKDAPEHTPSWMRTIGIWSEESQREVQYFVVENVEGLVYLANLGTIPVHLWASRVETLERPDWCVIDLDPKDAPFSDVITVARSLHEICEAAGMPHFVKTTGKTGLHILMPLGRQCTYEQSRTIGDVLSRLTLRANPAISTMTRQINRRGTKVYLDWLQNRQGQTIVAPFSVRPLPGATVSMPLVWEEVNASLDPKDFTIRNALARMEKMGRDPNVDVLAIEPDLPGILARLASL
jgi:bifunctional non-homologous end joining protein LigD